jgi:hypothetical protein
MSWTPYGHQRDIRENNAKDENAGKSNKIRIKE